MKVLFTIILTTILCFPTIANDEKLIGLQKMSDAIAAATHPDEIRNSAFVISVPNKEEAIGIKLIPSEPFSIIKMNLKNTYKVVITKPELLLKVINEDQPSEDPIWWPIYPRINGDALFKISGSGDINPGGTSSSMCSIEVEFRRGKSLITPSSLNSFDDYKLEYDESVLELDQTIKNKFVFKRKNNSETNVRLILIMSGVVTKIDSLNIAKCTRSNPIPNSDSTNTNSPINGQWTDWSTWSVCSESCGGGIQYKQRECTNPAPQNGGAYCSGESEESRACNTNKCQDAEKFITVQTKAVKTVGVFVRKHAYSFVFFNNHPTKMIKCDITFRSRKEQDLAKDVVIQPKSASDKFEGKLEHGGYVGDSVSAYKVCQFID